ncbi:MAG TPA: divalent metal cation transporter, partial [Patescibacteria group bacterium]|nr:divalent metal cation transporter [Patescibacteria group bacterium]
MKIWPTHAGMPKMNRRNIRDFFASKKEGVVTGAADNDPSGVVTYLQVGATTGFSQLWLLILSTPFLIVVEEMSSRVGAVLKKGLGRVLAERYGMKIAFAFIALVALANIATISADL